MLGPGGPLGTILNSVGGSGMAGLVQNIASGPASQLLNTVTQGSGMAGQLLGQAGFRPENLLNFAGSLAAGTPAGAAFQTGFQAFQDMSGLMQQSLSMGNSLRQAGMMPRW